MRSQTDLVRKCPNPRSYVGCQIEILYKRQDTMDRAEREGRVCKSCRSHANTIGLKRSEETKRRLSLAHLGNRHSEATLAKMRASKRDPEYRARMSSMFSGENHPNYGKPLSEGTKEKISRTHSTPEAKARTSEQTKGERNPMWGRRLSAESRKRIGEANRGRIVSDDTRQKLRRIFSGSGNPMFGKPAPEGSGRGIGGWFNGYLFRSSSELRFLMESDRASLISAEFVRISYKSASGVNRNYIPDFFDSDEKLLIEVKYPGWKSTKDREEILLKEKAAIAYCGKRGWSYSIVEVAPMSQEEVFALRHAEMIQLDKKWEARYRKGMEVAGL